MNYPRQPGQGRVAGNKFEVLETLGTGSYGKVKRAINCHTREQVALKVMHKLDPDDSSTRRRFNRLEKEVDAMRRCGDHPHTVSLIEARFNAIYPKRNGERVEAHILVLELCERGELCNLLLKETPLPPAVCQEYFRQLMSGIEYCHDQDVCHRDLKPENLLLDADFNLKNGGLSILQYNLFGRFAANKFVGVPSEIADFGFAGLTERGGMCHSNVGSEVYMAPEVINRRRDDYAYHLGYDGAKVDVWSAGVILFTMLAGHPPMEKATSRDWWFQALSLNRPDLFWEAHERTFISKNMAFPFSEMAKDLIIAMLRVEPSHRIGVDQIMEHPYLRIRSSAGDPRVEVRRVMQERYDGFMASRHFFTAASSSMGTADTARAGDSSPASAAAAAAAAAAPSAPAIGWGNAVPFGESTYRSTGGEGGFEIPTMTEGDAAKVTGGFMAVGSVREVVKALGKALQAIGAEVDGMKEDGTTDLRETFKVSAVIKGGDKIEWHVRIVSKVFRVVTEEGEQVPDSPLMVVLRRKRGDYYRYCKLEEKLVSHMATGRPLVSCKLEEDPVSHVAAATAVEREREI